MTQIIDVSPMRSNTAGLVAGHSVIGRMLSLGCTPDAQTIFAGSYSNLWSSYDTGQNWQQLVWPQPDYDQFTAPGSLGGWGVVDIESILGWRVEKHPRMLAQLTPSGFLDIVGFGDCGVWTALGNGDGTFQPPRVVIPDFGYQAGGWQIDLHPRFVADITGKGYGSIVGFGDAGVYTAVGNGDGTFQPPNFVLGNYGYQQDWRPDRHLRFLAQLTPSGCADIVGFGEDGVWIALSNGDGTFREPTPNPVLYNFCYHQDWRVEKHPRFLAQLTSSGFNDIVGFGTDGIFVVLGNGDGTFREPHPNPVLSRFCYAQGWRVDKHPRFLAPLTTSGFADIVGFGDNGVYTALSNGDGTFRLPNHELVLENFGYQQGWRVETHPRFVTSLSDGGLAGIIGCGDAGVFTAFGNGDGTFTNANFVLAGFSPAQGWQVDKHPRFAASLAKGSRATIVGIGDAGVETAVGDNGGGFPGANFVLANFGYAATVLAITVNDRVAGSRGIWKSSNGGGTWAQVYQFPAGEAAGQLQWALGSDHLVYAAGGSALAISQNAGTTFESVFPWGEAGFGRVNHVAVWQQNAADPFPTVIYALGDSVMYVSFDGGVTWIQDKATLPIRIGGAVSSIANSNTPDVMVIAPGWPLEIYVAGNGSGASTAAVLYRGNYGGFAFGGQTSSWEQLPLPDAIGHMISQDQPTNQDSGNVFLAVTKKGRGDLLFYGSQRPVVYVGPLYPSAGTDWHQLDTNVHYDLHGILLSPDFQASLVDGVYQAIAGTVWLLGDGGIYYSSNGGDVFTPAAGASTLSSVNAAGVSFPGLGPAFSLNTGDNDGFFSPDGGQTWSYQDYGGGDNDCSYADPQRAHSMMVFTPRWDAQGHGSSARDGQTVAIYENVPGNLPNAAAQTTQRHVVPGPPLLPDDATYFDLWNAGSYYGSRGSRPIVLGLAGEVPPTEGDYIFILNPVTKPVLVRTQNILDIVNRSEWVTTATAPGQGANVYLQGPKLPFPGLGVVQASGGHADTVFYVGGNGSLYTWTQGRARWKRIVPRPGATTATRFFVDPYRPNLIYILDSDHVKRSDDGGQTWVVDVNLDTQLSWNHAITISTNDSSSGLGDHFDLLLTDMQFDPNNASLRFAVGQGGVVYTYDGTNWTRLLHSGALPCRPANCYYDPIFDPISPALYVSTAGRGLLKITDFLTSIIF